MIYRLGLPFLLALPSQAADACFTIHGRAHFYGDDGQLRILARAETTVRKPFAVGQRSH
jgi:hypothetical protein